MVACAAHVMESISGEIIDTLGKDIIFGPLQMISTGYNYDVCSLFFFYLTWPFSLLPYPISKS